MKDLDFNFNFPKIKLKDSTIIKFNKYYYENEYGGNCECCGSPKDYVTNYVFSFRMGQKMKFLLVLEHII